MSAFSHKCAYSLMSRVTTSPNNIVTVIVTTTYVPANVTATRGAVHAHL